MPMQKWEPRIIISTIKKDYYIPYHGDFNKLIMIWEQNIFIKFKDLKNGESILIENETADYVFSSDKIISIRLLDACRGVC